MIGLGVLGGGALAVAGLAGGAVPARADDAPSDKLAEILARGHLIVGTGSDLPPFYYTDENGTLVGLEIDLARLLAKGLFNDPDKVEFIMQTPDSRIPNLVSNRVDITLQNLTVTAPRAQQIEFSIPYYRTGEGFLLLQDGPYKSFDALKAAGSGVVVSAIQNAFIADWVHEVLPDAKVVQYPTPDAALQALNAGQAATHYVDHSQIDYLISKMPGRYLDSGVTNKAGSLACGIQAGQFRFLNFVNTALREAMVGVDYTTYAGILKKWLGIDVPTPKVGYPHEVIS
jgi:polar amino acid transport system substrate-binding protein